MPPCRRLQIRNAGSKPAQPAADHAAKMQGLDIIRPHRDHGVQPGLCLCSPAALQQLHRELEIGAHDPFRKRPPDRTRRIIPPSPGFGAGASGSGKTSLSLSTHIPVSLSTHKRDKASSNGLRNVA